MSQEELLLGRDRDFNDYAQKYSVAEAFGQFSAKEGIMLRDGIGIIQGSGAIADFLKENLAGSLEWSPSYAKVSQSGDLGYTYGDWVFKSPDKSQKAKGMYVSIWEKRPDWDHWYFVLDTGINLS